MLKIVALAGGVGGAKLVDGLYRVMPPENLTVIVNTGDDFEHWGLKICPDLDTVCYTLAGIANPITGWGIAEETWQVFDAVSRLHGPDWFRIGDNDLGTHLERTRRLRGGMPLSQITLSFCHNWGIKTSVLPMTDLPVATIVKTAEGDLPFQEYFVHRACEPLVKGFYLDGIQEAEPADGVRAAISQADAIIICPSNPWVSIDPILAVLSREASDPKFLFGTKPMPIVAVSPIIGGEAIKGPAAKMFRELGLEPSALSVAQHYLEIGLSGLIIDAVDERWADLIRLLGIEPLTANTIMRTASDRRSLAEDVLNFISEHLRL